MVGSQTSGTPKTEGVEVHDFDIPLEEAYRRVMNEMGVTSWLKLSHGHDFTIMRASGTLNFTLMSDGWHKCTVMWRSDLEYSEEIAEELVGLLGSDT